jgi:hypothetical protein
MDTLDAGEVMFALTSEGPLALFPELEVRGHGWYGELDEQGDAFWLMVLKSPPTA